MANPPAQRIGEGSRAPLRRTSWDSGKEFYAQIAGRDGKRRTPSYTGSMAEDREKQFQRLLSLTGRLLGSGGLSVRQLGGHSANTKRQIQRDLNKLRDCGLPLHSTEGDESAALPKVTENALRHSLYPDGSANVALISTPLPAQALATGCRPPRRRGRQSCRRPLRLKLLFGLE